jgi:hypothetical protein
VNLVICLFQTPRSISRGYAMVHELRSTPRIWFQPCATYTTTEHHRLTLYLTRSKCLRMVITRLSGHHQSGVCIENGNFSALSAWGIDSCCMISLHTARRIEGADLTRLAMGSSTLSYQARTFCRCSMVNFPPLKIPSSRSFCFPAKHPSL